METRNIIDHYHYWNHDAILADLDTKRNNFTVCCCNVGNDFNIATIIRNANAFLSKEVWIYGRKQYDRRGTVGTHLYTKFKHVKEIESLSEQIESLKQDYGCVKVVGVDNVTDGTRICLPIDYYTWDSECHHLVVFGQEQIGIPKEVLDMCDDVVYIRQFGTVRSLNVGTASGIVMYDYCSKTL
jgi:tRNA G18 (ribose-2'-O)-methylase SpoU